jgi:hypothetical protein
VANRNPYQARLAKALRNKPGDLESIKRRTWGVLCLAYAQLAGVYLRLYEVAELEPRLQALEAAIQTGMDRP